MIGVEIFSKENCVYCTRAKKLCEALGIEYTEHQIGRDLTKEDFLKIFPNARTVPQIMVNGQHVGGYEEFAEWKEMTFGGYGEQRL